MKEQFVSYEIAKELKELGFDELCLRYYNFKKNLVNPGRIHLLYNLQNSSIETEGNCSAPLYLQIFDWFREKYKTSINIKFDYINDNQDICWWYMLSTIITQEYDFFESNFNSYKEAREAAILKMIELCKNR